MKNTRVDAGFKCKPRDDGVHREIKVGILAPGDYFVALYYFSFFLFFFLSLTIRIHFLLLPLHKAGRALNVRKIFRIFRAQNEITETDCRIVEKETRKREQEPSRVRFNFKLSRNSKSNAFEMIVS